MGQLYPSVRRQKLRFVANGQKSPNIYTRGRASERARNAKCKMQNAELRIKN